MGISKEKYEKASQAVKDRYAEVYFKAPKDKRDNNIDYVTNKVLDRHTKSIFDERNK